MTYEQVRARAESWANNYMAIREKASIEIDPWAIGVAAYLESWAATSEDIETNAQAAGDSLDRELGHDANTDPWAKGAK